MSNELMLDCIVGAVVVFYFLATVYYMNKCEKEKKRADYWFKEFNRIKNDN